MKDPIYLIDGYGLIYRAYYALIRRPLRNQKGLNTSAIFGFFMSLFKLMDTRKPDLLSVIMDSKVPTFRHKRYPEYKASREKTPEDLHEQIPRIENLLDALGISSIRMDGYEADDIIGSIARRCEEEGRAVYIYTKDKDLLQLVSSKINILYPSKGPDFEIWGPDEVFANRGIRPDQIRDYLALAGDSSDNIPGVSGIGEKTAISLLTEYGSLEGVYENLDLISSKSQKEKLARGKDMALLSQELATLFQGDLYTAPLEQLALHTPAPDKARELFHEEDIKAFDNRLGGSGELASTQAVAESETSAKAGDYTTVLTEEELNKWLKGARKAGVFALDVETNNIDALLADPIGFSLSCEEGKACYIPIVATGVNCLDAGLVKSRLKELCEDPKMKIVGQNIKYDYKVLNRFGITLASVYFDTMIAAWVLEANYGRYNMDDLALRYLNYQTLAYSDVVTEKNTNLSDYDIQKVTAYAAEDADITFRLYQKFSKLLKNESKLEDLFFNIEMPLVKVLAHMEIRGICLDRKALDKYSKILEKEIDEVEKRVYAECGFVFNLRSTKELQDVLFNKRGLKPVKKTKTGFSTDSAILEQLAYEDVVARELLRHRVLTKLKSTYVDALPALIHPETGRIHTHFIQTRTATGRLSSQDPNLQNIPIKDQEGRIIRSAFHAAEGCQLLSADYSQIELVILAHLSQDPKLSEAFRENRDIHKRTSSFIFKVPEDEVSPAQRRVGKTINFGVIYGMSGFRLSKELKIKKADAEGFIETYFDEYAGVRELKDSIIQGGIEKAYVETIMGRRRKVPNIKNSNRTVRMAEERIAVNTPIQGSAADIVKVAMISIDKELKARNFKAALLLQVHDELIFEVPEEELTAVKDMVMNKMTSAVKLSVPLRVSAEIGKDWGSIH
ncbi:MAG: DNA polymerase I [Spirochaetales bacterium]|nr:DNA polymerase I [Spirochaetales bacterium]